MYQHQQFITIFALCDVQKHQISCESPFHHLSLVRCHCFAPTRTHSSYLFLPPLIFKLVLSQFHSLCLHLASNQIYFTQWKFILIIEIWENIDVIWRQRVQFIALILSNWTEIHVAFQRVNKQVALAHFVEFMQNLGKW